MFHLTCFSHEDLDIYQQKNYMAEIGMVMWRLELRDLGFEATGLIFWMCWMCFFSANWMGHKHLMGHRHKTRAEGPFFNT